MDNLYIVSRNLKDYGVTLKQLKIMGIPFENIVKLYDIEDIALAGYDIKSVLKEFMKKKEFTAYDLRDIYTATQLRQIISLDELCKTFTYDSFINNDLQQLGYINSEINNLFN